MLSCLHANGQTERAREDKESEGEREKEREREKWGELKVAGYINNM